MLASDLCTCRLLQWFNEIMLSYCAVLSECSVSTYYPDFLLCPAISMKMVDLGIRLFEHVVHYDEIRCMTHVQVDSLIFRHICGRDVEMIANILGKKTSMYLEY